MEDEAYCINNFLQRLILYVVHGNFADVAFNIRLIKPKPPKLQKPQEEILPVLHAENVVGYD